MQHQHQHQQQHPGDPSSLEEAREEIRRLRSQLSESDDELLRHRQRLLAETQRAAAEMLHDDLFLHLDSLTQVVAEDGTLVERPRSRMLGLLFGSGDCRVASLYGYSLSVTSPRRRRVKGSPPS